MLSNRPNAMNAIIKLTYGVIPEIRLNGLDVGQAQLHDSSLISFRFWYLIENLAIKSVTFSSCWSVLAPIQKVVCAQKIYERLLPNRVKILGNIYINLYQSAIKFPWRLVSEYENSDVLFLVSLHKSLYGNMPELWNSKITVTIFLL